MKQLLFVIVAMMCWIGISSASSGKTAEKAPRIVFATKVHDFGSVREEKSAVTCQFKFTNKGNAPLVIVSATASCGCTKPSFSGEPIAPGKTGEITVTYNTINRPGEFNKNITVRTNDPKNKKVVLKITGNVVPRK